MKKSIFIIVYILVVLILIKLLFNAVTNTVLISKYKDGDYSEQTAYALTLFNFPESYVADYNLGNVLYKKGDYNGAIEQYKKALDRNVPKRKECSIRINYALSICNLVHVDENNKESIENAIKEYEKAIEVLVKQDCANDDGDGHSEKAQQLKDDIEKEIERLKELLNQDDKDKDKDKDNPDDDKDNPEDDKKNKEIEDKIKDIKADAIKQQREKEESSKNLGKKYNDHSKKNW
ncbi:MAG: tetratricopeptide repeat protein [Clostridia bacterium]|nr:tetratricopeptide repeat protein [Clostridia bacterium]